MKRDETVRVVALIPARGGSKSVPRKNLIPIGGKPLIGYTIELALACAKIDRVIVSTDDKEIADTARHFGAEVPFMRPAHLAADDTPDLPVFQHALTWLLEKEGALPTAAVHLRPTYPLRRPEVVDSAIEAFLARPDLDSLRSVNIASESPYKMWRIDEEGLLFPVVYLDDGGTGHSRPRQALPRVFWQNGYVDVVRPETVLEQGSMGGSRILSFLTEGGGLEIDYMEDIEKAERTLSIGDSRPIAEDRFPS